MHDKIFISYFYILSFTFNSSQSFTLDGDGQCDCRNGHFHLQSSPIGSCPELRASTADSHVQYLMLSNHIFLYFPFILFPSTVPSTHWRCCCVWKCCHSTRAFLSSSFAGLVVGDLPCHWWSATRILELSVWDLQRSQKALNFNCLHLLLVGVTKWRVFR